MKKELGRFLFILAIFFNTAYACTPIAAVIRHGEDKDVAKSASNDTMLPAGVYHAIAYINFFNNFNKLAKLDACPFKEVWALGDGKPMETAQIIAQGSSKAQFKVTEEEIKARGAKKIMGAYKTHCVGKENPPHYSQIQSLVKSGGLNLPCYLLNEIKPPKLPEGGSIIIVLNVQTMTGQNQYFDPRSFLAKFVKDTNEIKKLQSAPFNGLYVLEGQNPNLSFNKASAFFQIFSLPQKFNCAFRLGPLGPNDPIRASLSITGLTSVNNTTPPLKPGQNWIDVSNQRKICPWL